jgi:hypothetical protein
MSTREAILAALLALAVLELSGSAEDSVPGPGARAVTLSVTDFQNRHPFLEDGWIATAAPDLIVDHLMRLMRAGSPVVVLDRSAIGAVTAESALVGEGGIARGRLATHVVGGSYTVHDGTVDIDAALAPIGQAPTWTTHVTGPVTDVAILADRIARGAWASLTLPLGAMAESSGRAALVPLAALMAFHRGRDAVRRGDHAWALADLLRACSLAPDFGDAWLLLGSTLEALGRPGAAMAAWEQAVTVGADDPAMPETLYQLARSQENQTDRAPARILYQRLIDEYPFSRSTLPPVDGGTTSPTTYAQLAAERLAQLLDRPRAPSASGPTAALLPTTPGVALGAPAVPAHSSAVPGTPTADASAAEADLVAALVRQLTQAHQEAAAGRYTGATDEQRLQLLLLRTAGEWPSPLPAVRLKPGVPIAFPYDPLSRVIAPPPGQIIDRLTISRVDEAGVPPSTNGFMLRVQKTSSLTQASDVVAMSVDGLGISIDIAPEFGAGLIASTDIIYRTHGIPSIPIRPPDLNLVATTHPVRPGSLWIVTEPRGAIISVAGLRRGISPCRITDLAPGPVTVTADTLEETAYANGTTPSDRYLHFREQQTVTVAPVDETREYWVLPHRPATEAERWSHLTLAVGAPLTTASREPRAPWIQAILVRGRACMHPRLGALLAWTTDAGVMITSSPDDQHWNGAIPLHAQATKAEAVTAVAASPHGQILVVYKREHSQFAVVSDDAAATWSGPVQILSGTSENEAHTTGALWSTNRWVVVAGHGVGDASVFAHSADGHAWTTEPTVMDAQAGMYIDTRTLLLDQFADGTPALVSVAGHATGQDHCLVLLGLDQYHHWAIRDRSPTLGGTFTAAASLLMVGRQVYEVCDEQGTGGRWHVGEGLISSRGLFTSGLCMASCSGEKGARLFVAVDGSWWMASETAATPAARAPDQPPATSASAAVPMHPVPPAAFSPLAARGWLTAGTVIGATLILITVLGLIGWMRRGSGPGRQP